MTGGLPSLQKNSYDTNMSNQEPITIMIHDLNPWGGQDRSMLEIAWQLNKKFPLEIHSFSLQGYNDWPNMKHIQYEALIKKPILFKYLTYHLKTWQTLSQKKNKLIQSTGTASLKSHTVQVQFIHHTWQKIAKSLPADKSVSISPLRDLYHSLLNAYKRTLEKRVYTPDKFYIAISHSIKKELMEHFNIPSDHISIIYHGVDSKHFHPVESSPESLAKRKKVRDQFNIKDDDKVLLHVGALNSRKGLFQTFRVLSYLKDNGFSNVKYLAVGGGDHKIINHLIEKHNLKNEVILAPHSKDIRNYYWAADVFFFPSFYEPFGLVILEAMACGLPVVTSHLAGGAELVNDHGNGILFDPNSPISEIANQLLPVLRDDQFAKQISINGRKTAEQRSWEKVGQEYQEFYQKLKNQET